MVNIKEEIVASMMESLKILSDTGSNKDKYNQDLSERTRAALKEFEKQIKDFLSEVVYAESSAAQNFMSNVKIYYTDAQNSFVDYCVKVIKTGDETLPYIFFVGGNYAENLGVYFYYNDKFYHYKHPIVPNEVSVYKNKQNILLLDRFCQLTGLEPPISDYGLFELIDALDIDEYYIRELKATSNSFRELLISTLVNRKMYGRFYEEVLQASDVSQANPKDYYSITITMKTDKESLEQYDNIRCLLHPTLTPNTPVPLNNGFFMVTFETTMGEAK